MIKNHINEEIISEDENSMDLTAKNILKVLFESRDMTHYWHLQTTSYAEHKALMEYYEGILDLTDSFVETYQGINKNRVKGKIIITLNDYPEDKNLLIHFDSVTNFIQKVYPEFENNTDLSNILDEILELTNKTKYLLSLK